MALGMAQKDFVSLKVAFYPLPFNYAIGLSIVQIGTEIFLEFQTSIISIKDLEEERESDEKALFNTKINLITETEEVAREIPLKKKLEQVVLVD